VLSVKLHLKQNKNSSQSII